MKYTHKSLKSAVFLLATFLTSTLLLAPSAMAATAPGSVGSWTTSTNPLPQGLSGATSVTYNGYVYVMGGTTSGSSYQSAIYYAKLNSNGSVGSWTTSTNPLPQTLALATSVTYNGYVYVMDGDNSGTTQKTVYYAKLNSDGSVGSWTTSTNPLPQTLALATSVTYNGYVYVMGGTTSGSSYQSAIYYAKLNSDGSVGSWTTSTNPLPQALEDATSVTDNGYVYVTGGNNGTSNLSTTYYAKLNSDGSVGSWTTSTNPLPQALGDATSVTANGYVYVIGGNNGTSSLSTVYYAKLNNDGSVGSWTTSTNPLPQAMYLATSVTANSTVYVLGGSGLAGNLSTVYYASLIPDPITSTNTPSAPNTGYGIPAKSNPLVTILVVGAIVTTGAGLAIIYRQKLRAH